jgi:nucleoside-diphosphate-sugar epimerase
VTSGAEEPAPGRRQGVVDAARRRGLILTGASGLIGHYLLPRLMERGFAVQAVSRRPRPLATMPATGTLRWTPLDLQSPWVESATARTGPFGPADGLVHAAPIWLLPAWLPAAAEAGVDRLVAFSSTSRFTRQASGSPEERATARRLAEAEEALERGCRERRIRWTILRPTLVYGAQRDRNVSAIARFVRRFGFFPIAGEGRGARQPVHAADLAGAALAVLDNRAAFDRAYETPGGETLTYAEMVSRIARGVGRAPRLVHLPLPVLRGVLVLARRLPGVGPLAPDMADRMNQDLVFDSAAARRDFGYDPRPFRFPDEPPDR